MATRKSEPKTEQAVEVRILCDCAFGKADDVVSVPASVALSHAHELDAHPDAVAYAKAQAAASASA